MLLGLMQVNAGAKTSFPSTSYALNTLDPDRKTLDFFWFKPIEKKKKEKTEKNVKELKKDREIEALTKKKQWGPHEVPIVQKGPGVLFINRLCSQHLPSPDPLSSALRFLCFSFPPFFSFLFASVSFFHGDIISLISAQFIHFLENGLPPPVPAPLIDSTRAFEHLPKHLH